MFEWKGRKFDFKVPGPLEGCAIYDGLVSYTVPFGISGLLGLPQKQPMNAEKLREFQTLCLQNTYELLGNPEKPNKAPVIDAGGGFGITDYSAPLLTSLTSRYITFFTHWWLDELPSDSVPAAPDTPQ